MNTHYEHVLKNSVEYDKVGDMKFELTCWVMDTESCRKYDGDNNGAKVYGWGLGNVYSDTMVYGQDLKDFITTAEILFYNSIDINNITIKKVKKKYPEKYYIKVPCGVHNLAWDIEFFKYTLAELGFNYRMGERENIKSKFGVYTICKDVEESYTYHIVQNNNVVYGATIYYDLKIQKTNEDGSKTDIGLCLDLFDTYKIITAPESSFNEYCHVDEMFLKMSEQYDYDSYREEDHKQNEIELRYQYNDIYLLKEVLKQFYIETLGKGSMISQRTASSIAFNELLRCTFGEHKTQDLYVEHFELNKSTKFETTRKRLENASYSGGYTHANHNIINKTQYKSGCSLDINSSYPSQMKNKKFPYGKPTRKIHGAIPQINKENETYIIECGFDYVKPKRKEFSLDVFKIGAINIKALKEMVGNVSGQEYFCTNIKEDGTIINVYKEVPNSSLVTNYNMVLTECEFLFLKKHFDFGYYELNEYGCPNEDSINFQGLKIGDVLIYKAEVGLVKPFVEKYAQMKIDNKKIGNKALTNQAKLMLNSAYGKFGTKTQRIETRMTMDKNGLLVFTKDENAIEYQGKEFYKPYASFVTAYGRLQLWNAIIYAVGVDKFAYCDTDSIYSFWEEEHLVKRMNEIGEYIDKTELGCWDVETHFNQFKVLGQKKYMIYCTDLDKEGKEIGYKVKCCGLPKEARKLIAEQGIDEFYLGKVVEGKLQKKRVIGGALLLPTKFEIKKIAW